MTSEASSNDLSALATRLAAWQPEYPEGRFAGQGIVICAGGARVFTNAYVLVTVLRNTLGCELPIEVWHFGASEMSPAMATLLQELDVEVVSALPSIAASGLPIRDGWQLKPFALQHCRFEEVLMLDADQVPVRDPAELFVWPEYLASGAVFWPDIVELREDNPVWEALGLPPRRTISLESGQLLVDKRRHWRALSVVTALNVEAERLYRMIYGDKDTFLIGWQLTGAEFALVPHAPFTDERCLVQRDFAGAPLFQHRTNSKWSYAGSQHQIEGFAHQDDCVEALIQLKRRWNGRVFHAPDRSSAARAVEAELVAAGPHQLEVIADETLTLELLPLNEIGAGRANDRQNWWCEDDGHGIALVIADADRICYRLKRLDSGQWEGLRLRVPEHAVTMRAVPGPGRAATSPGLVDQLLRASGFPRGDRVQLEAALRLLCRVEPGALARLKELSAGSAELQVLFAAVAEEFEADSVGRDMRLGQFYRFSGKDGD